MHLVELTFPCTKPVDNAEASDAINLLLADFRTNGQICGREWSIVQESHAYKSFVMVPELTALEAKHHNQYVRNSLDKLVEIGLNGLNIAVQGEDIDGAGVCTCEKSPSYILYTDYVSLESPLRCGHCFLPIPLYRIPPTYDDSEYHNIICWASDYQSCDSLQMDCKVLERAATREMSNVDSNLSVMGRDLCRIIAEQSGTPTYYYLYRYQARSRKQELARKCPSCGGDWLLESPFHGFDFKCDRCFLVSNIAFNV